jgi:thiamine-phosphate pyrophosphorylase
VFATTSKTRPDPVVGLDGVRMAVARATLHALPVVAIGGITLERAPAVIAAGASSVAVISDLLADDLAARARAFVDALG